MRKRALDAVGRALIQRIHPVSIEIINPLGIKGLGEIDVVGTATTIANATYHATEKRVRDLPITWINFSGDLRYRLSGPVWTRNGATMRICMRAQTSALSARMLR